MAIAKFYTLRNVKQLSFSRHTWAVRLHDNGQKLRFYWTGCGNFYFKSVLSTGKCFFLIHRSLARQLYISKKEIVFLFQTFFVSKFLNTNKRGLYYYVNNVRIISTSRFQHVGRKERMIYYATLFHFDVDELLPNRSFCFGLQISWLRTGNISKYTLYKNVS